MLQGRLKHPWSISDLGIKRTAMRAIDLALSTKEE